MAVRRTSMKAPLTASTSPTSCSPTSGARYWARDPLADVRRPTPVKCARAPSGVGNERLAAWSKVPSVCTSRQPATPIAGSASMRATMWSRAPADTIVSGFSSSA